MYSDIENLPLEATVHLSGCWRIWVCHCQATVFSNGFEIFATRTQTVKIEETKRENKHWKQAPKTKMLLNLETSCPVPTTFAESEIFQEYPRKICPIVSQLTGICWLLFEFTKNIHLSGTKLTRIFL